MKVLRKGTDTENASKIGRQHEVRDHFKCHTQRDAGVVAGLSRVKLSRHLAGEYPGEFSLKFAYRLLISQGKPGRIFNTFPR